MRKCFVLKFSYFRLENGVCFLDIVEHNHYGVPQGSVSNLLINNLNSLFKGTVSVISIDPQCKDDSASIHNGTLKSFAQSSMNVYDFFFNYFQLWVLYKSDLRISTAQKHMGTIRNKHFHTSRNKDIFHITDQMV